MSSISPSLETYFLDQNRLIDLESLKTLSGNDEQFIGQLFQLFLHKAPETMAEVDKAFANRDYEALRYNVHSFKSTVSIFGNANLSALVGRIERMAIDMAQWSLIETDMNELHAVSQALMNEVTRDLQVVEAA